MANGWVKVEVTDSGDQVSGRYQVWGVAVDNQHVGFEFIAACHKREYAELIAQCIGRN